MYYKLAFQTRNEKINRAFKRKSVEFFEIYLNHIQYLFRNAQTLHSWIEILYHKYYTTSSVHH